MTVCSKIYHSKEFVVGPFVLPEWDLTDLEVSSRMMESVNVRHGFWFCVDGWDCDGCSGVDCGVRIR